MSNSLLQGASVVADTTTRSVDYSLFRAINGLAGRNRLLDEVMIGFAKYSPFVLAAVLLVLWLTWNYRNQLGAALAGIAALIALGIGQVVGSALPRDRPYLVHQVAQLI